MQDAVSEQNPTARAGAPMRMEAGRKWEGLAMVDALLDELRRRFRYNDWANRGALAALRTTPGAPERASVLISHLVGTEWHWLKRMRVEVQSNEVWPRLSFDECAAEMDRLVTAWAQFLSGLGAEGVSKRFAYTNLKGETFESSVLDICTHVLFHGAYHRGQIAACLRVAESNPPNTDFIRASRCDALNA